MPRPYHIPVLCTLLLIASGCTDSHGCDRAYSEAEQLHQQLRESRGNPAAFNEVLDRLENHLFETLRVCADDARPLAVMAEVQISAGQPSLALAYAQKALATNPELWQSQHAMASALSLLQQYPEAVPHAEQASRLAPERPGLTLGLCRAYSQAGRHEQAIETCTAVIDSPASELHALAYNLRGDAHAGLGQTALATEDYRQAEALGK